MLDHVSGGGKRYFGSLLVDFVGGSHSPFGFPLDLPTFLLHIACLKAKVIQTQQLHTTHHIYFFCLGIFLS